MIIFKLFYIHKINKIYKLLDFINFNLFIYKSILGIYLNYKNFK